jgi:hypothetical protein
MCGIRIQWAKTGLYKNGLTDLIGERTNIIFMISGIRA